MQISILELLGAEQYTAPTPINALQPIEHEALSTLVMTLDEHWDLFQKIQTGQENNLELIRSSYERLVRDKDSVIAQLSKHTKDQLAQMKGFFVRPGMSKPEMVMNSYEGLLNNYGFLTLNGNTMISNGYTLQNCIDNNRTRLSGLTTEHLVSYSERHLAEAKKAEERVEAHLNALKNPQTLEDFKIFISIKGKAELTNEQLAIYDELVCSAIKSKQAKEAVTANSVPEKITTSHQGGVIIETIHTRDNYPLFVVQLEQRVSKEEFTVLNQKAKNGGGWYSSFKGNGATPGFQFKDKDNASFFLNNCSGNASDQPEAQDVNTVQPAAYQTPAQRLSELGKNLISKSEETLNADRNTNTHRRASMASHIESRMRKDIALGNSIENVATAVMNGTVKHLQEIKSMTQFELLEMVLDSARYKLAKEDQFKGKEIPPINLDVVKHIQYPEYFTDAAVVLDFWMKNREAKGVFKLVKALEPWAGVGVKVTDAKMNPALLDEIIEKLNLDHKTLHWQWVTTYQNRRRLVRMGITRIEQLRAACREYVGLRSASLKPDPVVLMERALIGANVGIDFFPTPHCLAEEMVLEANIQPGQKGLEPHAGNGNIAVVIRNHGVEPDVCEIAYSLREILEAKGFNLVGDDFLQLKEGEYDFIIANPPFGDNADITHTLHAYSLLKDKGVLVTVIGEGTFTRSGNTETQFRNWLDKVGAKVRKLPPNTFNDPQLLATTGANARVAVIHR